MSVRNGGSELDRDLHERAVAAVSNRRADLVARALEIATATGTDARAWALIRLAADLRALDRGSDALLVLDAADRLSPSAGPECAAFTVAIAVHCDSDDLTTAVTLEQEQAARSVDAKFASVCARLYAKLYTATRQDEHRSRRDAYAAAIDVLGADARAAG